METKRFRALLKQLRTYFPVDQPVIVRRVDAKKNWGITIFDGTKYRIRISSDIPFNVQLDTLLHEWAHVCSMEEAYQHKERWAALYGKIYDLYVRDFNNE
jgi:hypothetical protein